MNEQIEIKNAKITSAEITNGDHGILSAWLGLDYGGTCQGFGGYVLHIPNSFTHSTDPEADHNFCGLFIWRVLEIAEVEKWSQLVGKTIRVKCTWTKCKAIVHILKDDWFDPEVDFKALQRTGEKLR